MMSIRPSYYGVFVAVKRRTSDGALVDGEGALVPAASITWAPDFPIYLDLCPTRVLTARLL